MKLELEPQLVCFHAAMACYTASEAWFLWIVGIFIAKPSVAASLFAPAAYDKMDKGNGTHAQFRDDGASHG